MDINIYLSQSGQILTRMLKEAPRVEVILFQEY
jgi:hypothetical protein